MARRSSPPPSPATHPEKGMALGIVVVLLLVLLILYPLLLRRGTENAKSTVKEVQSAKAQALAEAAVDRGLWELQSSGVMFSSAVAGIPLTKFNDDFEFHDLGEGSYKIKISTDPGGNIVVLGKGLEKSGQTSKALQSTYQIMMGAVWSTRPVISGIGYTLMPWGVHWGPIFSNVAIGNNSFLESFPRKYCRGRIPDRDPSMENPPNTDNVEWWDYLASLEPPTVDLDYYRDKAKNSTVLAPPSLQWNVVPAVANPPGSGYFPKSANAGTSVALQLASILSPTSVIFFDDDTGGGLNSFANFGFIEAEALLFNGFSDIYFSNNIGTVVATIPVTAPLEYRADPTVWTNANAPGTGGGPSFDSAFTLNRQYTLNNVGLVGFLYSDGNVWDLLSGPVGGKKIVGGVITSRFGGTIAQTGVSVFYSPDIMAKVRYKKPPPLRLMSRRNVSVPY